MSKQDYADIATGLILIGIIWLVIVAMGAF